jgi:hypothetical protein
MKKSVEWLLEDDNPSVKYYTLINIVGEKLQPADEFYYEDLIQKSGSAAAILSLQDPTGLWQEESFAYNPLYRASYWQLYFLSLLGIRNNNPAIKKAVELMVKDMQTLKGAFPSTGRYSGNLMCLQGITLEMLLRFGYFDALFTQNLIDFVTDIVFRNDFRCKYRQQLKCPWGIAKIVRALNNISVENRNESITKTLGKATKFLLSHDIVEANYPRKKDKSRQWDIFGFPRGFQSDILEITQILVDAGCSKQNTNLKNALKYIHDKKLDGWKWKMEFSLNGRMLVDIEKKNKPSKWVTYFALKTLLKSKFLNL